MTDESILRFERPPVSRIFSLVTVLGSAAVFFMYLAEHPDDFHVLPLGGLALLFLGTLAGAVMQYGDHIYLSDIGLKYENRLLRLFGKSGRWMRWEDIVEVREVRRKMLVLLSRDGRRLLVDAILGYAIARAEIVKRSQNALLTGTLAMPD